MIFICIFYQFKRFRASHKRSHAQLELENRDDEAEYILLRRYNFIDESGQPRPTRLTNKYLPIFRQRADIMKAIRENPVVVIEGATGCGKTTQVRMKCLKIRHKNSRLVILDYTLLYYSHEIHCVLFLFRCHNLLLTIRFVKENAAILL